MNEPLPIRDRAPGHDHRPDALASPPKATFEEARGFALAMTRMVFDHRGGDVIELAKSNIRNLAPAL